MFLSLFDETFKSAVIVHDTRDHIDFIFEHYRTYTLDFVALLFIMYTNKEHNCVTYFLVFDVLCNYAI